jgi:hypothetical protein
MLRDQSNDTNETNNGEETRTGDGKQYDWHEVDQALRRLADDRARIDAEEARWLRIAEKQQIWREVGCVSLLEYMERRLGYKPHAANERLRVALALEKLPALELSLANGELPFSAARELTRVATPDTESAWLDAGRDKSVHEIEGLVAGHKQGDLPTDPPDPELVMKTLRFEVKPATYALMRQARAALQKERGERLDDDQFLAALCGLVLDEGEGEAKARSGRAKFQIGLTICKSCNQGWQQGAGAEVPVDAATVARAKCDAQYIGSIDTNEPVRATQDIPPKTRRYVEHRDKGKCTLPWCRAAANLEIHHIVAREDGGSNDPENLAQLCDGHHSQLHQGLITITGQAPDKLVIEQRHDVQSRVGPNTSTKLDHVTLRVEARAALVKLGYSMPEAAKAVGLAWSHVGPNVAIDLLVREAIKRHPKE